MSEHETLTVAEIVALGAAVIMDDTSRAVGFDHTVVERILADRIRRERETVLRKAATALEAQPPKLRGQYVAALRLYAAEPWRLEDESRPMQCGLAASPTVGGRTCPHTSVKASGGWCVTECKDCTLSRLCDYHHTLRAEDLARAEERRDQ